MNPATTTSSSLVSDLVAIVGSDGVLHQPRDLTLYEHDAALESGRPDYVVLPETTEQVSQVLRCAYERGIPVTPRGAGTSLSGGPVPLAGGIVLALTRMDRLLELDTRNHRAVVQPGLINMDLVTAAEKRGFFYAPDPSSQVACTMGGNVGENSGGPHCLKYGVTTNHVLGLTVVLPDGEVLRTGGKAVGWPGYDLTGVVVGSEGTLGVVTEITCRLLPLPEGVTTMLAIFDSLDDASRTVSDIIAAGLLPATLEMMDRPLMRAVQMAFDAGYPEDAEVVLIIEVDGLRAGMARQLEQIREVCGRHNVRQFQWAEAAEERARLWRGRKGAFGAAANLAPSRACSDVAVPRTELPRVLAGVMAIGARFGLQIGNVFHAGDGNLHPQILFDARDPDQVARAQQADEEICRLALSAGGVLTGEHGIGCCKRKWMPLMFTASDLRAMWALKEVFDPRGLINPHKVLPERASLSEPKPVALPYGSYDDASGRLAPRDDDGTSHPYDVEAVAKLLALAAREGQKLVIRGGGSKSAQLPRRVRTVCTLGLRKILSVDNENLTVQAEAGVRWADLQAAVAQHGQWVPLRPSHPAMATVGGVIATDDSGPHRLRHGTCRDLVTGLRFVLPGGEVVSVGGKCIKNTSGYALEKLLIGSHGSLGVIVEATLRTFPLPEATGVLIFRAPSDGEDAPAERIAALAAAAVGGHLLPAAVEALTPALACPAADHAGVMLDVHPNEWVIAVGIEGLAEEVEYMATALADLAARHGMESAGCVEHAACAQFWQAVTDIFAPTAQATCVLSETMTLAQSITDRFGWGTPLRAGPGTGVVVATPTLSDQTRAEAVIAELHALAQRVGGCAHWLPPIPAGARNPEITGAAARINRRIKAAYDPAGLLPAPW